MSLYTDHSIEVEVTDNGWVLRWKKPTETAKGFHEARLFPPTLPKTNGIEVFAKKADLIKRIKELI